MAEFFEQICKVLAENAAAHPGQLTANDEIAAFFRDTPRPAPAPPPVSRPAPVLTQTVPPVSRPAPQTAPPASVSSPAVNACGNTLDELAAAIAGCRCCPLAADRKNIVFGEGNPQARLMFIGEGPGYDEDLSGRPFVGKAGQLLDKMITAMQFTRQEVYIANVVKCHPRGNRNPMPDEMDKCMPILHRQIELIRPEVIVCLGAIAAKALLNTQDGISRMRGKWQSFNNIPVMPTFHPAYLLRQESAKRDAWSDLQLVMARFDKKPVPRRTN